ncbi:uncharacterized protein LOC112680408, partial [Sipha flava]|uniref:Uncharacterized protein LOC112680408 n=1 Tax=Sipha flava TaxID=143950 RepID=A0A8B8F6B4_9HEMI
RADDKIESTTEYLTGDENHIIFEASQEIFNFSELNFSDLFNYDATDIMINKESETSKITESLEKIESSNSNFMDMENEVLIDLTERDANTMTTYEIYINKSTMDIEENSSDYETTVSKKKSVV